MKVQSLTGIVGYPSQVRPKKQDDQQEGFSTHGDSHDESRRQTEDQEFSQELEQETLSQAVESFQAENASQGSGLNAAIIGDGPGLRVVLKDPEGALIKQFTGEEFLRLRHATQHGPQCRGKILDHKL